MHLGEIIPKAQPNPASGQIGWAVSVVGKDDDDILTRWYLTCNIVTHFEVGAIGNYTAVCVCASCLALYIDSINITRTVFQWFLPESQARGRRGDLRWFYDLHNPPPAGSYHYPAVPLSHRARAVRLFLTWYDWYAAGTRQCSRAPHALHELWALIINSTKHHRHHAGVRR